MILATKNGDVEFSAFDSSTPIPRASQWGGSMSWSGRRVDVEDAAGLPAFFRALRLLCETPAGFPMEVYRGHGENREPTPDAPQVKVLRRPSPAHTPFQVWDWTYKSMLRGNAYLWKVKGARGVEHLVPVDPRIIAPKYDTGEARFEIRDSATGPLRRTVGKDLILHIPGILISHPCVGVSIIEAQKNGLGTQISRQEFEARFIANDGKPGMVISHEQEKTPEQREAIRSSFEARHAGASNAGRPAVIWGGWSLEPFDLSLEAAQFIEQQKFSVQDVGRMTGVPSGFLNDPEAPGSDTPEQENMRLLQFGLKPWMDRLEQGLASDPDLFPDPECSVEINPDELLRADIKTRFDAYRLARQGGWIKANEIRRKEGYPEAEGGDEIQVTPVGGAPNTGESPPEPPEPAERDEAMRFFSVHEQQNGHEGELAAAGQAIAAAMREAKPAEFNFPEPVVNNYVSPPAPSPAPEVKVDVDVPAPEVTVQAPNVTVEVPPRKKKVKRDGRGRIEEIEES